MKPILLYIADPMCSWCWGFAPVMREIRERYARDFDMSLLLGGLATGQTEPVDQFQKDTIRQHWEHVAALTEQPFDYEFFDREGFVYDTEPACRAVVTVRGLAPGNEFDYLETLQRAFYANNRAITNKAVLADLAVDHGVPHDHFLIAFEDPKTRLAAGNDFSIAASAGISGFPAVLIGKEASGLAALTVGYQPLEPLTETIDKWLEKPPQ